MKQKLIVIISIFLIIIFGITYYIYNQNLINEKAFKNNKELESYTKNEITGTELVTLINKAIDINDYLFTYSKKVKNIVSPYHLCRNTNY